MSEVILRTEDLTDEDIQRIYVPTDEDKEILQSLKSKTPVILCGSRGMGKSFLFKVSEIQVREENPNIVPVYVTFRSSCMLRTSNENQFTVWMLSTLTSKLLRQLKKKGIYVKDTWQISNVHSDNLIQRLENTQRSFEESWNKPGEYIDVDLIPTVDNLIDLIEDICEEYSLERIIFYIDEAAHVFIPEEQIQFFNLFRDLRSAHIKCNASVYPGVTYYGDFERRHDCKYLTMTRSITESDYEKKMSEMVLRQLDDAKKESIKRNYQENFKVLAYASGGNPRVFLKSIEHINFKLNNDNVNKVMREFYRTDIWSDHSNMVNKYPQYTEFIDWGREFVETVVLPEIKNKNDKLIDEKGESSIYFWVDRNAPKGVNEALRLLEYSGLIKQQSEGVKGTGSAIGLRYEVTLGCLLSQEQSPAAAASKIVEHISLGLFTEFGANNKHFKSIKDTEAIIDYANTSDSLLTMLDKSINSLELTNWQKESLKSIGVNTIKDLLQKTEQDLQQIHYVAGYRSRQMRNAALEAIFEYLY